MKIYGTGAFKAPGTSRVVWEFEDGPFDTDNQSFIAEAKRRGYSFTPPPVVEAVRRKPGRPKKAEEGKGAHK